jgi:multidrug efflux pump subunit AcrB
VNLFELAGRNRVFANLMLGFVLVAGLIATVTMVREMFPVFSLDMVTVRVPYPGASPEEVEEGICRKLEEAIESVIGVKEFYTQAAEGVGVAIVEIDEDVEDKQSVQNDIRDRVEAISTFPVDAERPIIAESYFRRDVINLALWGDAGERVLKEYAEEIKSELRALPEISQVEIGGLRPYEISIEVSEERLRQYGLSLPEVSDAVRRGSLNMPSGTVRTREGEIKVRTLGRRYTAEEFADLVVLARPDGSLVRLDRIATIRDDFEETAQFGTFNGKRAALIVVQSVEGEDAITMVKAVRSYVERKNRELSGALRLTPWRDLSRLIEERIDILTRNGLLGFALVFLLLWLFLDLRLAFWVGLGIPVSLAGGLVITGVTGGTINMLSLFSMIMVVGIVVDDAVVVGEAVYVHRKQGKPPLRAAIDGVREVWWPVTGGVTTTIIAFVPFFFVEGMMGKFFAVMPVVVIGALVTSLVESLFILPAHLNDLPDLNARRRGPAIWRALVRLHAGFEEGIERFVARVYQPYLRFAVRWRYVVAAIGLVVLLVTAGVVLGGLVKFVLFPQIDSDFITAHVDFPDGTPESTTQETVVRMAEAFRQVGRELETRSGEPLIVCVWATIGEQRGLTSRTGNYLGEVTVELLPSERRGVHSEEIKNAWRGKMGPVPEARRLEFLSNMGGPRGTPIEVRLLANDLDRLIAASRDLKERLAAYPGVFDIADDHEPGKPELRVRLKPLARTLGLTLQDLAVQVRAMWFGDEAMRIQRGRDDIRIKIRYPEAERRSLAQLDAARIRTPSGGEVPLADVAELRLEQGYAAINRQGGFRRVVVTADVDDNVANAQDITDALRVGFLPGLADRFPGLVTKLEGMDRDRRESVGSLFVGLFVALIGMFVILATVFRSYVQPFLILLVVPMGFVGVVVGHLVLGMTVTLLSLLGVVALAGVAVNDAIVFIDYFNKRVRAGGRVADALVETGGRRFRAMYLTTFTTVGGLLPLMLETSFQAQYLIPMAVSISFGLAFATMTTLTGLPALMAVLNDVRRVLVWFWKGEWPAAEAVEPDAPLPGPSGSPTPERPIPAESGAAPVADVVRTADPIESR